jgi:hypothetical protein
MDKAEADALRGKRVRFRKGGFGTVEVLAGLVAGNPMFAYAVQVLPDSATQTILLTQGDATGGEWAFDLLP